MIAERRVGGDVIVGPAVHADPVSVLVPEASAVRGFDDLGGKVVCLMVGSPGQAALEAHFGAAPGGPIRSAYREDAEMLDAYNVGACDAAVGQRSYLAEMRASTGINRLHSRVLPGDLGDAPILLVLPASAPAGKAFAAVSPPRAGSPRPAD